MKIGLDVRMINNSGIGVTIRELLNNLSDSQLKEMVLLGPQGWENPYPTDMIPVSYPVYGLGQHFFYSSLIRKQKLSLFHMPHYDVPMFYNGPFVATVHDLIHYLFPQFSTKPFTRIYSKQALEHVAKRGRRLITVSDNTKKDLELHFPKSQGKIQVVYPGVNHSFRPLQSDKFRPVLEKYNLEPGYFLYVGNLRASKNTPALISAYAQLKKRHPDAPPLVLVGKTFLKNLGAVPHDLFHIENASFEELPAFYSAAAVFVYPSLYEGFGLPPLEAMACGAPVISSNAASLPEVCGEAAEYVDPKSETEIAETMWSVLTSSSKKEAMKKKGMENVKRFSWKRFAHSTWQIYQDAIQ